VVTDDAGKPVSGLQRQDFTLFDNKKPQPILSFQAVDGQAVDGSTPKAEQADPPVELILLVDTANTSLQRVAYERYQLAAFLRQNGGHLAQPVTLMIFSDLGVKVQPRPSSDGNLLAKVLDQLESSMHTIPLTGGYNAMDRMSLSLKTLTTIAAVEGAKPGRKLLIWIGPGWPMLESPGYQLSSRSLRSLFDSVVVISRALREARITMYSVYPRDPQSSDQFRAEYYKNFLTSVPSAKQVSPGNLALPIFAIHSGGQALQAFGDLPKQINICVADAQAYYTLSFDPPSAEHVDEYHEIAVQLDKPHLKARTNTGYYAEPGSRP
jgi:VWFA-related protein